MSTDSSGCCFRELNRYLSKVSLRTPKMRPSILSSICATVSVSGGSHSEYSVTVLMLMVLINTAFANLGGLFSFSSSVIVA